MRRLLGLLAVCLIAFEAVPAGALTVTIGRVGGTTWDMLAATVPSTLTEADANGVQTWNLTNPFTPSATTYTVNSWSIQLKVDPFVTNNVSVTNTSAVISTFVATVLLPIPAFGYNAVISSSVGVTVTDSNGVGDMLFDVSGVLPIYNGFVGFPVSTTLLAMNPITPGTLPITTADCPFPFAGCTATSANGVASLGVAPGIATLIGLTLTFQLSPGDTAALTSRFEIASVPEPATLALLGFGLLAFAVARRRAV